MQIVFLFILLLALSVGSTIGASIRSVCVGLLAVLLVGMNVCFLVGICFEAMVSFGIDIPGRTRCVSSFLNEIFLMFFSSAKEFIEGARANITPICNRYSLHCRHSHFHHPVQQSDSHLTHRYDGSRQVSASAAH